MKTALEVEAQRFDDGYRVIPLLLEGLRPSALGNWFDTEPLAVPIELKPGGLSEAMPRILAALGQRAPDEASTSLPIRILLISPRPENKHTGYIEHRASALPLVSAIEGLGDLVALTVLSDRWL